MNCFTLTSDKTWSWLRASNGNYYINYVHKLCQLEGVHSFRRNQLHTRSAHEMNYKNRYYLHFWVNTYYRNLHHIESPNQTRRLGDTSWCPSAYDECLLSPYISPCFITPERYDVCLSTFVYRYTTCFMVSGLFADELCIRWLPRRH